jgi:hypothetical protein
MQPTNYFRAFLGGGFTQVPPFYDLEGFKKDSVKFTLPPLDESITNLVEKEGILLCSKKGVRLPFERIIIESPCLKEGVTIKRISLCRSIIYEGSPAIKVCELRFRDGRWKYALISSTLCVSGGKLGVAYGALSGSEFSHEDAVLRASEMASIVIVLLGLMSCQNVVTKPLPRTKAGVKLKPGVIPFDDYYTLAVKRPKVKTSLLTSEVAEKNRPREHLRRGHFQSFKTRDGHVTHWVNPVVVNEGIGAKIHKSYFLEYE